MAKTIINKKFYSTKKSFKEGDFVYCDYFYGYYKLIKFVDSYDNGYENEKGEKIVSVTKQWVAKKLIGENNKTSIRVREIPDWLLRKVTKEEKNMINERLKDEKVLKKFNDTPNETSFAYGCFNGKYKLSEIEIQNLQKEIKNLGENFPMPKLDALLKNYKDILYTGEKEYNFYIKANYRSYVVDENYDHICLGLEIETK